MRSLLGRRQMTIAAGCSATSTKARRTTLLGARCLATIDKASYACRAGPDDVATTTGQLIIFDRIPGRHIFGAIL